MPIEQRSSDPLANPAGQWSQPPASLSVLASVLLATTVGLGSLLSGSGCRPLSQITGLGGKPTPPSEGSHAVKPATEAPDILSRTLIVPNKPPDITASVAVYRLTSEERVPDIPSTTSQTALRESPTSLLVKVVKPDATPSSAEYIGREYPDEFGPYLRPTSWLQSNHPAIYRQAYNCLRGARRTYDVARNLEAGVDHWIVHKNLDTGFATALDTLRSRSGDCTEHALLLAAFARSQKIPSRVVAGLVYADQFVGRRQVFGYHMWTELYVGGQWLPFDAALHSRGGFDVTHIALVISDMTAIKADVELSAKTSGLVGKLRVEVLPPDTPMTEGGTSGAAPTSRPPPPPPPLPTVPRALDEPLETPSPPSPFSERGSEPNSHRSAMPLERPSFPMAVPITPPAEGKPAESPMANPTGSP